MYYVGIDMIYAYQFGRNRTYDKVGRERIKAYPLWTKRTSVYQVEWYIICTYQGVRDRTNEYLIWSNMIHAFRIGRDRIYAYQVGRYRVYMRKWDECLSVMKIKN